MVSILTTASATMRAGIMGTKGRREIYRMGAATMFGATVGIGRTPE